MSDFIMALLSIGLFLLVIRLAYFYWDTITSINENEGKKCFRISYKKFASLFRIAPSKYEVEDWQRIVYKPDNTDSESYGYIRIYFKHHFDYILSRIIVQAYWRAKEKVKVNGNSNKAMSEFIEIVKKEDLDMDSENEPRYFYTCDDCGKPMKKPYLLMKFDENDETECHLCCECAQSVLDFIMHNIVNHRKNYTTNNGKEEYKPSGGIP